MRLKKYFIAASGLLTAVAVSFCSVNSNKTSVEAKVKNDLQNIFMNDTNTLTSSNPYAYINNKYYDDIIEIGMDAVDVLSNDIIDKSQPSLDSYVAALAVSDITNIDMEEISGKDWETADEFWELWDEMLETMPSEFEKILSDDQPEKELDKYGIFADALLFDIQNDNDGEIEFANESIKYAQHSSLKNYDNFDCEISELEKAENLIAEHTN